VDAPPPLGASARAFRDYVRSPEGLALAPDHVLDLFDDEADPVGQFLRIEAFRDREFLTTIESRKLAKIIRDGSARKRVYVILDACFSASTASDWQGDEIEVVEDQIFETRIP
jgi:hypothetical protein